MLSALLAPLAQCADYIPVVCNLQQPDSLPDALLAAGLAAKAPVVWLAEGLFSFLPAAAAQQLLRLMAELSPSNSKLIASAVDGAFLQHEAFLQHARQAPDVLHGLPSPHLLQSSAEQTFGNAAQLAAAGWKLDHAPEDLRDVARTEFGVAATESLHPVGTELLITASVL